MLPLHCFNVVVQFEFEFFKFEFNLNLFEPFAKRKNRKTRFQPKPAQPSFSSSLPAAQKPFPQPVFRRRPVSFFPRGPARSGLLFLFSHRRVGPARRMLRLPRVVSRRDSPPEFDFRAAVLPWARTPRPRSAPI